MLKKSNRAHGHGPPPHRRGSKEREREIPRPLPRGSGPDWVSGSPTATGVKLAKPEGDSVEQLLVCCCWRRYPSGSATLAMMDALCFGLINILLTAGFEFTYFPFNFGKCHCHDTEHPLILIQLKFPFYPCPLIPFTLMIGGCSTRHHFYSTSTRGSSHGKVPPFR